MLTATTPTSTGQPTEDERQPHRAALVAAAMAALPAGVVDVLAGDGTRPAWVPGTFDRVLVDAPCSGLGALRRRPESRWRRTPDDVEVLVGLQQVLLDVALESVRPGGVVVHQDVPMKGADFSAFEKFIFAWQTKNNDEPFWDEFLATQAPDVMLEAGFAADEVLETTVRMRDGPRAWYIVLGEKPDAEGRRGTALTG